MEKDFVSYLAFVWIYISMDVSCMSLGQFVSSLSANPMIAMTIRECRLFALPPYGRIHARMYARTHNTVSLPIFNKTHNHHLHAHTPAHQSRPSWRP